MASAARPRLSLDCASCPARAHREPRLCAAWLLQRRCCPDNWLYEGRDRGSILHGAPRERPSYAPLCRRRTVLARDPALARYDGFSHANVTARRCIARGTSCDSSSEEKLDAQPRVHVNAM